MIVIATHDNLKYLNMTISNMEKINLNGHQVLIINTNSKNPEFIEKFEKLKNNYVNFIFKNLNYTCWDSGAYMYAFQNYQSDNYIFLQDSIDILDENYVVYYDELLKDHDVVAHCEFPYNYPTFFDEFEKKYVPYKEFEGFVENGIIFKSHPEKAIFGPIFAAKKEILNKIPNQLLIHPTNKMQACCYETRWSLIFHSLNAKKTCLEDINNLKYIKKYFPYRQ
jgi:hypothetical protein